MLIGYLPIVRPGELNKNEITIRAGRLFFPKEESAIGKLKYLWERNGSLDLVTDKRTYWVYHIDLGNKYTLQELQFQQRMSLKSDVPIIAIQSCSIEIVGWIALQMQTKILNAIYKIK